MKPEAGIYYCLLLCLSVMSLASLLLLSSHPRLNIISPLISPSPLSLLLSNLLLSLSAVLPSGGELETMEGPPDIPRLHGDEDPTRGSPVQQEEAIADGQREKQSREPETEIDERLSPEAEVTGPINLPSH